MMSDERVGCSVEGSSITAVFNIHTPNVYHFTCETRPSSKHPRTKYRVPQALNRVGWPMRPIHPENSKPLHRTCAGLLYDPALFNPPEGWLRNIAKYCCRGRLLVYQVGVVFPAPHMLVPADAQPPEGAQLARPAEVGAEVAAPHVHGGERRRKGPHGRHAARRAAPARQVERPQAEHCKFQRNASLLGQKKLSYWSF